MNCLHEVASKDSLPIAFQVLILFLLITFSLTVFSKKQEYVQHQETLVLLPDGLSYWANPKAHGIGDIILRDFINSQPNKINIQYVPIARAVQIMERGQASCYMGTNIHNIESFTSLAGIQSTPVFTDYWVFAATDPSNRIEDIDSFKNKSLARLIGQPFFYNNKIKEIELNLSKLELITSEEQIFKMLSRGRIDVGLLTIVQAKKLPKLYLKKGVYSYKVDRALGCNKALDVSFKIIGNFNLFWEKNKDKYNELIEPNLWK